MRGWAIYWSPSATAGGMFNLGTLSQRLVQSNYNLLSKEESGCNNIKTPFCMSSWQGRANLCIVPILVYVLPKGMQHSTYFLKGWFIRKLQRKKMRQRQRKPERGYTGDSFHLLVHPSDGHNDRSCTKPKPGVGSSFWVSQVVGWGPNTWVFCCFPHTLTKTCDAAVAGGGWQNESIIRYSKKELNKILFKWKEQLS